ncbi:MAG: asparagine synthase (glutamine-hydrolyzing) [Candidatus Terrybacteria bacterium RIFCSPHIGHO2_02_41_19]|uniref:asparagine synthase (glutamine-hydrolyzing) n=1 Tax=Candidatus Terrybacteria bacterium RIFCSPHIGHO2_02_41_19 TaxID=1802364 RepID=A0A1G2PT45_9BACT|nr:MAG: asparagine synthase (glutamine-hydrolyzing) [Candidatus Terrybacteria bacterium RIFCSPHIGHO2_02_41_19]
MCGIAGFMGGGNRSDLENMIAAIKHRGPDNTGVFFVGDVGLAHARLSVIDLSERGHQPMFNDDKTIGIVFNGEIYNFKELRNELIKLGYKFKSDTDTEVIIYLYEEFGESCFERLNGMFAIGLYDFKQKKLILARDRMGEKPLYWSFFGGTLMFASELRAIMEHRIFKKELNLDALNKYLTYEYVPTPHSIFKNVYKLEPASYLVYQNKEIKKIKFWEIEFNNSDISFDEAITQLDKKINESVKLRMVSDVPFGVFLSGGLDSSTIAYYAQKNSSRKIKTFSVNFEEKSFDESKYAKKVSDILGTEHYDQLLTAKNLIETLSTIDLIDEPIGDASIIPTYLLSKHARNYVTVALGGDGGDELFAGYPTFQADVLAGIYEKIPTLIKKIFLEKIIHKIPETDNNFNLGFRLKTFVKGLGGDKNYRHHRWLGSFTAEEKEKLFKREIWNEIDAKKDFEEIDYYLKNIKAEDHRNKTLGLYMRTYLMDEVLVKVDRASMKNSLEIRSPFLDPNLVELANSLPFSFKLKGFTTKYILKKLMEDKLPGSIVYRKKKGFGIPLSRWLRNELKEFCDGLLSEEKIKNQGLFNYDYIARLKQEHFDENKNNRKKLWTLMAFMIWYEKYMK